MPTKQEIDKAVDEEITIWTDRANGVLTIARYPLCKIQSFGDCGDCILSSCFTTPYGAWNKEKNHKFYAAEMVKMLEAYKNRDMILFNKYKNYWDGDLEKVVFE